MLQVGSLLKVSDNSGALIVKCIKVYGKPRKGLASIGDKILVSVKSYVSLEDQLNKYNQKKAVTKGQIYTALVVRTKKGIKSDFYTMSFKDNSVILLKPSGSPLATSIRGPLIKDKFRKRNLLKILSLCSDII